MSTKQAISDQIYYILRSANRDAHISQWHREHSDEENRAFYNGQCSAEMNISENMAHKFNVDIAPILKEVIDNAGYEYIGLNEKGYLHQIYL